MATLKPRKSAPVPPKVALPLPLPVQRVLAGIGADLNRARRRRGMSQKEVALRIGASVSTVKRMESGDPKMQFHVIARTLHLFGELQRLAELLDTRHDEIGLTLMDEQLPQRVRAAKKSTNAF